METTENIDDGHLQAFFDTIKATQPTSNLSCTSAISCGHSSGQNHTPDDESQDDDSECESDAGSREHLQEMSTEWMVTGLLLMSFAGCCHDEITMDNLRYCFAEHYGIQNPCPIPIHFLAIFCE